MQRLGKFMSKKTMLWGLVLGMGLFVVSCSESAEQVSSQVESNAITGTITVTGTNTNALSDFQLFIQNRGTGAYQLISSDVSGAFSFSVVNDLSVTNGNNFFIGLVENSQTNFRFIGPLLQQSTSTPNTLVSGFEFSGAVSDFDLTFDADRSRLLVTVTGNVAVSPEMNVRLVNQIPRGASRRGRLPEDGNVSRDLRTFNSVDGDEDGFPNIFDTMNNGQDLNNLNADGGAESVLQVDEVSKVRFIAVVNTVQGGTAITSANIHTVTDYGIVVHPSATGSLTNLKVETIDEVFSDATVVQPPNDFTTGTYPTIGSNWLTADLRSLYAMTLDSSTVYAVFVRSQSAVAGGNLALLEFGSSPVTQFLTQLHFTFSTPMLLVNTGASFDSGAGTQANPFVLAEAESSHNIFVTVPKDENGISFENMLEVARQAAEPNEFDVLSYSIEYQVFNDSDTEVYSATLNLPDGSVTRDALNTDGDLTTSTKILRVDYTAMDAAVETLSPSYAHITVVARTAYGDRVRHRYVFKRDTW